MKYHIQISTLKKKFHDFTEILSKLIDQDIEIQIIFPQITTQSQNLIKQLEEKKLLNLSKQQTIPLNQFAQIFQQDKDLQQQLKDYIVQKLQPDIQIEWFIQDKNLITNLNCKNLVEEFLNKLFYQSTVYEEYANFISAFPNIKTLKISQISQINQDRPLKDYRNKSQIQNYEEKEYFVIYGYKHHDQKNIFQKKIVLQEYETRMHNVFTDFYIPIIKPLIEKYYYTLINVREEKEIIDFIGPHHLLKEAVEVVLKEFKNISLECGPIRTTGLNKEFLDRYEINEFIQQKKIIPFEIGQQTSQFQEELQKSLQPIKSQTFLAVLFVEFNQSEIQEASYYFNFQFNKDEIEEKLQHEAEKIAQNNINGLCVCYFSIVFGVLQSSQLKKQLYDQFNLEKEEIYNQNLILYLNNQPYEQLQNYEDQYKILIELQEKNCQIIGKRVGIDLFLNCLKLIFNEKNDIIDFYQYKSLFHIKAIMIDFYEKYQLLIQQSECKVDANITNTRIKITGKQNNINKLIEQIKELEQIIDNQKIVKQISIQVSSSNSLNQKIKLLQQDYPSIEVIQGECDEVHLTLLYSFKRKQTRIRLCNGSPSGLFEIREELKKLNKTLFLIPVEKTHNTIQKPTQFWENELTQKRSMNMIRVSETKFYKIFKYEITLPLVQEEIDFNDQQEKQQNNNKKQNNKNKYQIKPQIIEYQISHIYYRDYKNPENFIHYFDNEVLEQSLEQFIKVFDDLKPVQIIISCSDGEINKFQKLFDFILEKEFPKLTLVFLLNQQDHIEKIRAYLIKDFDEESIQKQNMVQHFSIIGCIQDNIEKIIQELQQI